MFFLYFFIIYLFFYFNFFYNFSIFFLFRLYTFVTNYINPLDSQWHANSAFFIFLIFCQIKIAQCLKMLFLKMRLSYQKWKICVKTQQFIIHKKNAENCIIIKKKNGFKKIEFLFVGKIKFPGTAFFGKFWFYWKKDIKLEKK